MSDANSTNVIADYLRQVDRALDAAGVRDRASIVEGLREHAELEMSADETSNVQSLIDRLGRPDEIVAAAAVGAPDGAPVRDWWAVVLLFLGGFALGVGWIIGLALVWMSHTWSRGQKILATVVVPGGLSATWWWFLATAGPSGCTAAYLHGTRVLGHCTSLPVAEPLRIAIGVVLMLASLLTAFVLSRQILRLRMP
jgi:hypothetical protein